jgi:hypothetical protein
MGIGGSIPASEATSWDDHFLDASPTRLHEFVHIYLPYIILEHLFTETILKNQVWQFFNVSFSMGVGPMGRVSVIAKGSLEEDG